MKKILIVFMLFAGSANAQPYQPNWESLDKRPVPQWYKDVKFGIFIHWGVYSVPAFCTKGNYAEWYQHALNSGDTATIKYNREKFGNRTYYQLADDFKAELFNPDEWADVFEKSGAKYIVLTSKHHDGFANWPSKEASKTWGFPWNAMETGPHRDLLGDLFAAVRKTSVHAGMYYSLYEWYNPLWLKDKNRYVTEHEWPQMKDLINTYKPDVFWTDGEWDASAEFWKSAAFLSWLYNESPVKDKVVTYDRWGSGVRFHHGAVYTPEYQPDLDFEDHYWEESRGMGFSYGYNREEDAWDYNSAQSLVLQLIDKVSRGGNFLLDIGPDEHGKIPPIMQERLLQIGSWLKANGEAIYFTKRWKRAAQWSAGRKDYKPKNGDGDLLLKITVNPDPGYAVKECFFTYNASTNNLYAILPKWPAGQKFVVHDLLLKTGTKIQLLETHENLTWEQSGNDVLVQMPPFDPNRIKAQFAYVLKIENTGDFAAKAKVDVSYPNGSLVPNVNITATDGATIRYTLDGSQPADHAKIYAGPFTIDSSATLTVVTSRNDALTSDVFTTRLHAYRWQNSTSPGTVAAGLNLDKFLLFAATTTDEMENVVPEKSVVVPGISIHDTLRRERTGLVYKGLINVPADAVYFFYLSSDDGSKLWIDNEIVIDNDGLHGGDEKTDKIALKKGFHAFKLSFFQGTGDAGLQLKYSAGDAEKKSVPAAWFYHKSTQ